MESKRKAYPRACSLASVKYRFEQGVATAQNGFENSAAACRPSEGYEDIQSETNDVDFTDKSFYNYCTSSRDSVDESLDCDETQRSKDCLAKEALRLNETNMSSSINEEETLSDGSPALTDLPAKAKVGNCVQYNGYNGCNTCDIYGTLVGCTVYWPYDPKATLRKHHEVLQYAEEATMTRKPHGVLFGPCHVFSFESANGTLRRYFHGSRNMSVQLMYSFSMAQLLPILKSSIVSRRPHASLPNRSQPTDGFALLQSPVGTGGLVSSFMQPFSRSMFGSSTANTGSLRDSMSDDMMKEPSAKLQSLLVTRHVAPKAEEEPMVLTEEDLEKEVEWNNHLHGSPGLQNPYMEPTFTFMKPTLTYMKSLPSKKSVQDLCTIVSSNLHLTIIKLRWLQRSSTVPVKVIIYDR
ncbi:hypothetical protein EMCRGX_G010422 [Ephydatia muelleri]